MATAGEGASIFDAGQLESVRRELRLDPLHVRRLRNAVMKSFVADDVALASFPAPERIELCSLALEQRHDSALDGSSKLVFRTASGLLTEAVVLRAASGRSTLCVSSQVGCAAACRFCATGTMGIARSFSVAEILGQVVAAGQLLTGERRKLRNVVFMGMGEPFHNEESVSAAVAGLTDPAWFHLSPAKIMVSTVGIIDGMLRFAERFPKVRLALSLHSVRQDVRERLVPLAKRYPLHELRRAITELNRIQPGPVMLEYLMLDGLTDTDQDIAALIEWTDGLDVHVNLIPYNPIAGAPDLGGSTPLARTEFARRLKASGRTTTMRRSLGRDIDAACGQLVKDQTLTARRRPSSTPNPERR